MPVPFHKSFKFITLAFDSLFNSIYILIVSRLLELLFIKRALNIFAVIIL